MKQVNARYNYDPSQPSAKQYQDSEVFNAYYKCFDTQTSNHYLLSHFKTQNKTQLSSLFKKFSSIHLKMQQGLNTKYLTKIHDVFLVEKEKSFYLISDYCQGGSIIDYIGKICTLEPNAAIRLVMGALYGLLELHKLGVVNCFINLQNIEIDQSGTPKLSFKCMIYKTIYLSPEFRREHVKSKQSDLYCLGVCLYRLIYGIFPFKTQKTQQLIEMVRKGPSFLVQKDDGVFSVTCPKQIQNILKDLLSINPEQRPNSIFNFQSYSKYLLRTPSLSPQIYSKLFKSKYINFFIANDENDDEHEYSILDPKQKKLLKLVIYHANSDQIEMYLKKVASKFAKLSGDFFLKIYEYQILQEEYLTLVLSYWEGSLGEYRKNIDEGFSPQIVENSVQFLKKAVRQLDKPLKYLTNEMILIKNGQLRIRFPEFPTRKFQQALKKYSTSGQLHFIAPEVLKGEESQKCDSWSIAVIEYWMLFNELPKLDSKGTLVMNRKEKLPKSRLLYFHHAIEKNPSTRMNVLDDQELKNKIKIDENKSELAKQSPERLSKAHSQRKKSESSHRNPQIKQSLLMMQDFQMKKQNAILTNQKEEKNLSEPSAKNPERPKKYKKKQESSNTNSPLNVNILPNKIDFHEKTTSKYKNPILIESRQPLPKSPNKFNIKLFNDPEQIKSPQKQQTIQKKLTTKQQNSSSILEQFSDYAVKWRSKMAYLQRSYTKPIRVSLKCVIALLIYLFLFYLNFFKISGSLIGSRHAYETKTVLIRGFSTDSRPSINYALVTKTPTQTNQMFYNTTVLKLRDEYKCVLNDYSVNSNVTLIVKSQGFVTYEVFGILIGIFNMIAVCIAIAKYDICKVCQITNFQDKKYHTIINYGIVILSLFSLTSFHYLIYGGLYHIMLEPCLGKSTLPGLQFLMKNWINSWLLRFIWVYIGIAIAYGLIVFFLIKPNKNVHKYVYVGILLAYFMGVGLRGMNKIYPAYENTFGVCGQLLGLLEAVILFIVDLIFACFTKQKSQNPENNIDTRSIEDFNRTEEFFFGNSRVNDDNEK